MEVYAVAQASPRDKPKLLVHVLDKLHTIHQSPEALRDADRPPDRPKRASQREKNRNCRNAVVRTEAYLVA